MAISHIPSHRPERQLATMLWYNAGRGGMRSDATGQTLMLYESDLYPGTQAPKEGDRVEYQMHSQVYGRVVGVKVVERRAG